MSGMQNKNGGKCVRFRDKKLAHVIQHGIQGFIVVKSIRGERTEANDLIHIF